MTFAEALSQGAHRACDASLSFDAAQAVLAAHAVPLGMERVPLGKAGRRVLAIAVRAALDAPRHDAAAMDGFAVRGCEVQAEPSRFRVVGVSYPGQPFAGQVERGEAVRIMTGAAMPLNTDRVLVREETLSHGGEVVFLGSPEGRDHVRLRASDMAAGDIVLQSGRLLDPRALLVAGAADAGELTVWRRPRVRLIASGDELAAPGTAASTDLRLPDCLSEALLLLARQWGGVPLSSSRVPDEVGCMRNAAETALADADVLVMVGGASRGDRDLAKAALGPLGLDIAFADVAMKPGKPVWYARLGDCHVLGLPGNPTAAFTTARLFLAPLLTALGGREAREGLVWSKVPLAASLGPAGDREVFLCADWRDGRVRVLERQMASAQLMLADANALVRRPAGAFSSAENTLVDVLKL